MKKVEYISDLNTAFEKFRSEQFFETGKEITGEEVAQFLREYPGNTEMVLQEVIDPDCGDLISRLVKKDKKGSFEWGNFLRYLLEELDAEQLKELLPEATRDALRDDITEDIQGSVNILMDWDARAVSEAINKWGVYHPLSIRLVF